MEELESFAGHSRRVDSRESAAGNCDPRRMPSNVTLTAGKRYAYAGYARHRVSSGRLARSHAHRVWGSIIGRGPAVSTIPSPHGEVQYPGFPHRTLSLCYHLHAAAEDTVPGRARRGNSPAKAEAPEKRTTSAGGYSSRPLVLSSSSPGWGSSAASHCAPSGSTPS